MILKITKLNSFLPVDAESIKDLYCGWHNSFLLTSKLFKSLFNSDDGDLYSTGFNCFGQLGYTGFDNLDILTNENLEKPQSFIKISFEFQKIMFRNTSGKIFLFKKRRQ